MSDFVDSPMTGSDFQKQGKIPEGSPGVYNHTPCPPFDEFPRTPSPNAVPTKFYEKAIEKPSGESDQF